MKRTVTALALLLCAGPLAGQSAEPESGLRAWVGALEVGLAEVAEAAEAGRVEEASGTALRLYLDHYEAIEGFYGAGGLHAAAPLSERVAAGEAAFHRLLQSRSGEDIRDAALALRELVGGLHEAALAAGVPLRPSLPATAPARAASAPAGPARTAEVRDVLARLEGAEEAYRSGDAATALARVEDAYLEGFEPLESRLPADLVGSIERLIHLRLRPGISRGAAVDAVSADLGALRARLHEADAVLAAGSGFWFGALNAFVIIVREGLEAVLLIGAMLAYLGAIGAGARHRRQIWAGVLLGIVGSFATWGVARTLVPVSGASRELIEGFTALVAVAVLLYVSHWLFHKTYVHDWKDYLKERVGTAVSTGSALAMAGLAFAAVYREGFETVLFYQALIFDSGGSAVLAGFLPGAVLITAVGAALIRMGVRLPIKRVFTVTNTVLLYLAFVFLGKGIYNLQEAGLFAPHVLTWAPDNGVLRQVFGLYPLAETFIAQAALLAVLLGVWGVYRAGWLGSAAPARKGVSAAGRPETARAG